MTGKQLQKFRLITSLVMIVSAEIVACLSPGTTSRLIPRQFGAVATGMLKPCTTVATIRNPFYLDISARVLRGSSVSPRLDICLYSTTLLEEGIEASIQVDDTYLDGEDIVLAPENYETLPEGIPRGFYVVKEYKFSPGTIGLPGELKLDVVHVDRLELTPINVTAPIALMMVDAATYPSLSRARKACRKGNILIRRGGASSEQLIGRVGDRVLAGDVICQQTRMGDGYFSVVGHRKPPFDLPVVYEDDHIALVNKPAGVVCYRQGAGQLGLLSVRAALPFVLRPPQRGTYSVLRRPASVHRLDKPTCGLLCVVKTKPAMVSMSRQFHDRIVKKTYMAIINGIPEYSSDASITSREAVKLGVDIDLSCCDPDTRWQLIDDPLDDKHAVTVWRTIKYVPSLHANDGYLTLVELKPKTGRHHQLRRHMAWHCQRPIVGDVEYDGGRADARKFRERGLFLCASSVTHEHPYYNSDDGRLVWDQLDDKQKFAGGVLWFSAISDKVMVSATLELPDKFHNLLSREEERFLKFQPTAFAA